MTENSNPSLEISSVSPERPSKVTRIEEVNEEVTEQPEEQDTSSESQSMSQKHGLQWYLVAIEYIGTRFSGSQQQLNCRTVVGTLEEAFHKFIGQPVSIFCSSRTDAGVHALANVCHVDVELISKRKAGEVVHSRKAIMERILKAKTVTAASPMAPASGLYLGHVKYDLP